VEDRSESGAGVTASRKRLHRNHPRIAEVFKIEVRLMDFVKFSPTILPMPSGAEFLAGKVCALNGSTSFEARSWRASFAFLSQR